METTTDLYKMADKKQQSKISPRHSSETGGRRESRESRQRLAGDSTQEADQQSGQTRSDQKESERSGDNYRPEDC